MYYDHAKIDIVRTEQYSDTCVPRNSDAATTLLHKHLAPIDAFTSEEYFICKSGKNQSALIKTTAENLNPILTIKTRWETRYRKNRTTNNTVETSERGVFMGVGARARGQFQNRDTPRVSGQDSFASSWENRASEMCLPLVHNNTAQDHTAAARTRMTKIAQSSIVTSNVQRTENQNKNSMDKTYNIPKVNRFDVLLNEIRGTKRKHTAIDNYTAPIQ
ncbi:hypothetical protein EVAR_23952_1 [Eumeta japonica]|uniref:Uncharacterized protein n=1 Tax=Eumeta variegata TaxID=151549 RepID=A0A4C1V199_EUMVA|nr:hypothetical protein EVAR_23952_1 [Eumeta japonica]